MHPIYEIQVTFIYLFSKQSTYLIRFLNLPLVCKEQGMYINVFSVNFLKILIGESHFIEATIF